MLSCRKCSHTDPSHPGLERIGLLDTLCGHLLSCPQIKSQQPIPNVKTFGIATLTRGAWRGGRQLHERQLRVRGLCGRRRRVRRPAHMLLMRHLPQNTRMLW